MVGGYLLSFVVVAAVAAVTAVAAVVACWLLGVWC